MLTAGGNVDRIRDILFGRQIREYDRRFGALEEQVERQIGDVRTELTGQLQSLETYVRGELGALGEQLRAERGERLDGDSAVRREVESSTRSLDKRLGEIADRTGAAERELRQVVLDTTRKLQEEMRQKFADVSGRMDRGNADLRDRKVDRATLAALLSQIALQLNDELAVDDLVSVGD